MNTIHLYREDVYRKEASAKLVSIEEKKGKSVVVLDQTLFFPEGGGQSADRGTLAGFSVLDVQEKDEVVYHLVDCIPSDLPAVGSEVNLVLDWNHRFDNMQRHLGEHIVSGAFHRLFGGVNRGFHMGDQYMTIDISMEGNPDYTVLTWDMIQEAELESNRVIWANHPVTVTYFETRSEAAKMPLRKELALDEDISIVTVGNPLAENGPADCVACCGTHPSSSGQVGLIKIYKVESNKGMFRIYLEAGQRALLKYQKEYDTLAELGTKLSAGTEDIMKKYQAQQEKQNQARTQLGQLRRFVIMKEAEKIRTILEEKKTAQRAGLPEGKSCSDLTFYYDVLTVDDLLNLAKELFDHIPKVVFLVHRPSNTVLLCSSGKPDCGKLVKENAAIYGGKGGGGATAARAIFQKEDYVDTFIDLIDKHLR